MNANEVAMKGLIGAVALLTGIVSTSVMASKSDSKMYDMVISIDKSSALIQKDVTHLKGDFAEFKEEIRKDIEKLNGKTDKNTEDIKKVIP